MRLTMVILTIGCEETDNGNPTKGCEETDNGNPTKGCEETDNGNPIGLPLSICNFILIKQNKFLVDF